ncbi:MAG: DNA polymerase ligase N-terminal domain-containing protein [Candidatus Woesearchaeota archaeon]
MSLQDYIKKRNWKKTPEPKGRVKKRKGNMYVIQQHFARRLHYDLRLEMNGVLKSWALPKEPIEDPAVRRLAVQTEDHPISYGSFEGTIPEGQYGAGDVAIWDKGTYKLDDRNNKKIIFTVKGKKLKGTWCLVCFKPQEKMWLLFKKKENIK